MTHILLSYAHEDADRASQVRTGVTGQGFKVWWDRDMSLVATNPFAEQITSSLEDAKCVLVLWTRHSIAKAWVRSEARLGLVKKKLIQLADGVNQNDLPPPFGEFLYGNLTGWSGEDHHPEFKKVVASIGKLFEASAETVPATPPQARPAPRPAAASAGGWHPLPTNPTADAPSRNRQQQSSQQESEHLHDEPQQREQTAAHDGPGKVTAVRSKEAFPDVMPHLLELPHQKFQRERDRLAPQLLEQARRHNDTRTVVLLETMMGKPRSEPKLSLPRERGDRRNLPLLDPTNTVDSSRTRPFGK